MRSKLLLALAVVAIAGAGAAASALTTDGDPPASTAAASTSTTLDVPTPLEDWCASMRLAFGGAAPQPPTVKAAFERSIAAGSATPEVAYVSLLEGIPAAITSPNDTLRAAGQALVEGGAPSDAASVLDAATQIDAFIGASCGS